MRYSERESQINLEIGIQLVISVPEFPKDQVYTLVLPDRSVHTNAISDEWQ